MRPSGDRGCRPDIRVSGLGGEMTIPRPVYTRDTGRRFEDVEVPLLPWTVEPYAMAAWS